MSKNEPTKGFVFVASNKPSFYSSALNSIESIRDYFPEAKFAFFTEERFVDSRCDDIDHLFFVGNGIREKLYGIANTPFDITMYIDADTIIEHEDICTVFDQLEYYDMKFVKLTDDPIARRSFVEKDFKTDFGTETLSLCGGVCLYDSRNPLVKEFMSDWHKIYLKQEYDRWVPKGFPASVCRWDQFTLWWLTNKVDKYKELKIGEFEDNYRWNWFTSFRFDDNGNHNLVNKHPIIIHHSATMNKDLI